MPIALNCNCGQIYYVRDDFAGRPVQCVACGKVVNVPFPERPSPGPRLRLPDAPLQSAGLGPLIAGALLILLGVAGFLIAFNWDRIADTFAPSPQQAEGDPDPDDPAPPDDPPPDKPKPKPKPPPVDEQKPTDNSKKEQKPPPPPPPPVRHPPFEGHTASVFRTAFSLDGQFALSASGGIEGEAETPAPAADSSLRLWDARAGQLLKYWRDLPRGLSAAAFSPGGRYALIASAGKKVDMTWKPGADLDLHLWDLKEGKELRSFSGHLGEVFCIAISPDGKHALSGGKDKIIRMWEVDTGKEINRLVGHTNSVNSIAFAPDGKHALSGGSDMTVRWWDLGRGLELKQLPGHEDIVWSVAVSPDGKQGLSAGGFQPGPGNKGLVPGSKDFAIRLWDLAGFKEVKRFEGHSGAVSSVAFTPDGKRIVSAASDRTVRLWLIATGGTLHTCTGHKRLIRSLAVSPDGRKALTGGDGGELKAWDLPPDLSDLLHALRAAPESADRVKAAEQLGLYGAEAREAVPDLLRAAAGEDVALRKAALTSLVQIGKPRVEHLPLLEPLLLPAAPLEVRRHVLDALTALGPDARPAAESVGVLLRDPDTVLRARAARTLGSIGPKHRDYSAPLLIAALRDTDADVVKAAREALDLLVPIPPAEVKSLAPLLADPSEPVRRYALDALAMLKDKALPAAEEVARVAAKDTSLELRKQALTALAAIGPREKVVLAAFALALKDRDATVARQAVQALIAAGVENTLPALMPALEHADAEVVKLASEALDNTRWEKVHARALGEALAGAGARARPRLLKVIGDLGADAEDAVPALRKLLEKPDPKEALPLVQTIGKIGPGAKAAGPELVPLLKRDPKMPLVTPLMLETAHVLVDLEAAEMAEAVPVLVSAIRIEDEEEASLERRSRVQKALVKVGKPAIPKILRSLEGEFYIGNARTPAGSVRAVARYMLLEVLVNMGGKVAGTPDVLGVLARLERLEPYPDVKMGFRVARMKLMEKDDPDKKDMPDKKDKDNP